MIELRHLDVCHFVIEVSPSSERLHSQMLSHRFDIFSLSTICLGAIICDINTMGFVSVYASRVCDALVASCATVH